MSAPDPNMSPEQREEELAAANALGVVISEVMAGHPAGIVANALINEYCKVACFLSETPDQAKAEIQRVMGMILAEGIDHYWAHSREMRERGAARAAERKKGMN